MKLLVYNAYKLDYIGLYTDHIARAGFRAPDRPAPCPVVVSVLHDVSFATVRERHRRESRAPAKEPRRKNTERRVSLCVEVLKGFSQFFRCILRVPSEIMIFAQLLFFGPFMTSEALQWRTNSMQQLKSKELLPMVAAESGDKRIICSPSAG